MTPLAPRALLLDLDNTVYPYEPCHAAGLAVSHKLAMTLNDGWSNLTEFVKDYARARQAVKDQIGPQQAARHSRLLYFKTIIETQFGRTDLEHTRQLHEAYWQGYFSLMKPDAGCAELLRDLRARGVQLAWVSNFTTERQMLKLRALGLEHAADFLITSEEAGADKPSPAIIDFALAQLRARPDETWLVGDDLKDDIGAARARSLTAVWFQRQGIAEGAEQPDLGEQPDFVVRDWFELRELLDHEQRG